MKREYKITMNNSARGISENPIRSNNNSVLTDNLAPLLRIRRLMSNLSLSLILSSLALTIVGCGNPKSDKIKDYSRLRKTMGPVHQEKTRPQVYAQNDLYILEFDSKPTFVVGQRNTLQFRTGINLPGVKYKLSSADLPTGAENLRDLGGGIWEFAWTPSRDLIPVNSSESNTGGFHVALEIIEVTSPQVKGAIESLQTEKTVEYRLVQKVEAPEILEFNGIATSPQITKIIQGEKLPIQILVKDLSASNSQTPTLIAMPEVDRVSQEQCVYNGFQYVFYSTVPEKVKEGIWSFKAYIDTENNAVKDCYLKGSTQPAPKALANATFKVLGANRVLSSTKTLTFEINYRRELLRPELNANLDLVKVKQGSSLNYKFETSLPSAVGTLAAKLSDESTALTGAPKISCRLIKKSPQALSCQIKWKIPCSHALGPIQVKALTLAEYQNQKTSVELIKPIEVIENKACSIQQPPSTKKSAKKNKAPNGGKK